MSQTAKPGISQEGRRFSTRQGWARNAAEPILAHAKEAFTRAGFADASFVLRWSEIAGAHIARIAQPVRWQEGAEGAVLTLKCEAGAAVLLQHQTRALTERLNRYLGEGRIARIKLKPGQLSGLPEPPDHPAPQVDTRPEKLTLAEAIDQLARSRTRLKSKR
jgi:hypothetical protein